jgi:hypothetical protein
MKPQAAKMQFSLTQKPTDFHSHSKPESELEQGAQQLEGMRTLRKRYVALRLGSKTWGLEPRTKAKSQGTSAKFKPNEKYGEKHQLTQASGGRINKR